MIVTCKRCATQFQLDDAKIPENGIQVQCSRCDHVFSVTREALPDADSPEGLAVDALLSGSSGNFDDESGDLLADDAGGDGESDWEFNDDGVIGGSFGSEEPAEDTVEPDGEMSIAEEAVDDLLANVDDMVSLDESALDDAEPEAEDPLGGFELEEPEPDSAEEESVVESPVIEPPPVEAPVIESPPVEAPVIESPATASPVIEPPPVVDVSEELGDLDNWDIFDEPSGAASDAASPGPAEQTLAVVENSWFGVKGERTVNVLWFYTNRVRQWYDELSGDVQQVLGSFDDPSSFHAFPHYSTIRTHLTATELNLLAHLTAWSVANPDNRDQFIEMFTVS